MVTLISDNVIHTGEDLLLQMLLHKKLCTQDTIFQMQNMAKQFQQTLFQHILQYQFIDPEKFCLACCDYFHLKNITLDNKNLSDFSQNIIPFHMIKNNFLLPIVKNKNQLLIAIANPDDIPIAKTLSFQLNISIDLRFTRYDILCRLHNAVVSAQQYNQIKNKNDQPTQNIAHQLLSDAIHRGASDIHVEPYDQHCRVRFRIDGMLHEIIFLIKDFTDAMTSCIKVLAHLDIAIKRMPQDGRLTFRSYLGFFKDCRVNTCPTIHGEKIVIRLLDANTQIRPIEQLGLSEKNQQIILNYIQQPQGLILVTGPTGSGKTITLYTLLNLLNQQHRNVATIEDPVEMQISGINQTHINTKTGLTFSQTLRALLRQDPDIIMIGEIRDQETAEMAIRAAQTGHLVLSTLHTNSAAEAITRLCHMGIAPFHLCSALNVVIAQRLVRKICVFCKTGCTHCTDGFQGRIGIFELMPVNEKIKQLIINNTSHIQLEKQNQENGHDNLWQAALTCVEKNITSLSEIYRVVSHYA